MTTNMSANALVARSLASWKADDLGVLAGYMSRSAFPAGPVTLSDPGWWVLTSGRARLLGSASGPELTAGDAFGGEQLAQGGGPNLPLLAAEPIGLAHLPLARYNALAAERPALALALLRALWPVAEPLGARIPRAQVRVALRDGEVQVPAGTPIAALLPTEVAGKPVVAATLDRKVVSLDTQVAGNATVEPLTIADSDGKAAFARSLGLLLLEAAGAAVPGLMLQLGSSTGRWQTVRIEVSKGHTPADLVARLEPEMRAIIEKKHPFRREHWTLEQACMRFEDQGWTDVVELLRTWRTASVTVVSCGQVHALAQGPFVPHTGLLSAFSLKASGEGLELALGDHQAASSTGAAGVPHHSGAWLDVLGVRNLGGFNAACVSGRVSQLIRVAEGYHEKRIGQIADRILARGNEVRAICIAGPSSSGKTTFIKRLTVQLQIDGLNPRAISLDDYYCDRDKTPLSPDGEYDYEALDALDLPLLHDHLTALMAGQAVHTAHYDFKTGKSHPDGGELLCLGPSDVVMLEGIHALNPRLLANVLQREQQVKVFVWPATTLPVDRLSHFALSDLRLLRRIVRDRHSRGADAAANIMRWPAVRRAEERSILPYMPMAEEVFDSSLIYEPAVLKVYAERYLLEVPQDHPAYATAYRLRQQLDAFIAIYPDHVPPTSILREFIGGSGFEY